MSGLTVNGLATLTNIDRRTIKKRLVGMTPNYQGEYPAPDALRAIYNPDQLDATQEKAKLDLARREMVELNMQVKRAELIPANIVQTYWEQMAGNCRARLLNLPGRLATAVTGAPTLQEAERKARELVYEALTELAEDGTPPTR